MVDSQDGLSPAELAAQGVDLAVAANANVAAPISGDASADAEQPGDIDRADEITSDGTGGTNTGRTDTRAGTPAPLPADLAAPITGAVAANANVAAPIDSSPPEAAEP